MNLTIKGVPYAVSDEATGNGYQLLLRAAKLLEGMNNTSNLGSIKSPLVAASITEGPGLKQVGLFLENGSWVWLSEN